MPDAPRVVVMGAGAIGCFVGGQWLAGGIDVRFVGRARIAGEIAGHGLILTDYSGWSWRAAPDSIDYRTAADGLRDADLIVVTVKCTALESAAMAIAQHAPSHAVVLSLLNGVRAAQELANQLPQHRVIAGMVPFNVAALGEGRWHRGTKGQVTAEMAPLTETVAQILSHSPARLRLVSDMTPVLWGKLLVNLNNPVNALSGLTLHEELSLRGYRRVFSASIREALTVLDAADIKPARVTAVPAKVLPAILETPDWLFRNTGLRLQKIDRTARSSMADDLATGRKTEIEFLSGEIVRLGLRHGLATPVNSGMAAHIRAAEANGLHPIASDDLARSLKIDNQTHLVRRV